jgi:hypothetical protein
MNRKPVKMTEKKSGAKLNFAPLFPILSERIYLAMPTCVSA